MSQSTFALIFYSGLGLTALLAMARTRFTIPWIAVLSPFVTAVFIVAAPYIYLVLR